jgi:hypothetical protein
MHPAQHIELLKIHFILPLRQICPDNFNLASKKCGL